VVTCPTVVTAVRKNKLAAAVVFGSTMTGIGI
jgi:hypothetical protein